MDQVFQSLSISNENEINIAVLGLGTARALIRHLMAPTCDCLSGPTDNILNFQSDTTTSSVASFTSSVF